MEFTVESARNLGLTVILGGFFERCVCEAQQIPKSAYLCGGKGNACFDLLLLILWP